MLKNYPTILIRTNKAEAIKRRHPWVFSGAIKHKPPLEDGHIVRLVDSSDQYLATGIFQDSSIAVRVLSNTDEEINQGFWRDRIKRAIRLRADIGLTIVTNDSDHVTNCFRLINGEGDGIPGIIIDNYNGNLVLQIHTSSLSPHLDAILKALKYLLEDQLKSLFVQNKTNGTSYKVESDDQDSFEVLENGLKFRINPAKGQKTGFFLDQRENRKLLGELAKGKEVTNLFSYSGGFSLYALKAGAKNVTSVDSSKYAMAELEHNLSINDLNLSSHQSLTENVMEYIKTLKKDSQDILIVDPPAFAKSVSKRHNAVKAYKKLNASAFEIMKKGGLMMSFSCSQVVGPELFNNTIRSAAIEVGKEIKILKHLSQGPDHPTNIYHPEGKYLKGLLLYVG